MPEQHGAKTSVQAAKEQPVRYALGLTPASFIRAWWSGTLPVDIYGRLGLTLTIRGGEKLRLSLDLKSAQNIANTLAEMLADYQSRCSQSDKSSGTLKTES
ncbi:MAG TPA: hypothetical protein VF735_06735 [Pyrinomonadaceae bacterium]|jgi:hypothetical protein